jgi:ElaB/YqjD/DUF883 family membrane-anchored ribosome-binding protein
MSATQSSIKSANGAPELGKSDVTKEAFDKLKGDFAQLSDDVRVLLSDAGKAAKAESQHTIRKGKALAGDAAEQAMDAKAALEDKIRAHPLTAVGIALGAGIIIAALRR